MSEQSGNSQLGKSHLGRSRGTPAGGGVHVTVRSQWVVVI